MKRLSIVFALSLLCAVAGAQDMIPAYDWAQFGRYAASSQALRGSAPLAVIMGDSITDGWADADSAFFAGNRLVGRGISGQVTAHMLVRFRRDVLDLAPEYVVIIGGINDIARNLGYISPENTMGNIASMCELAASHGIKPILSTVVPTDSIAWRKGLTGVPELIQELNGRIRCYASENGFRLIDFAALMADEDGVQKPGLTKDGIHPTPEGYKLMEEAVLQVLE